MDWLMESTGAPTERWLAFVQNRIAAHSRPGPDPNHSVTDAMAWVTDLAKDVMAGWPGDWESKLATDPTAFDENMRLARELGLVLCAWYASVQRAKTQDPRRPIELRRKAHDRRAAWMQALLRAITDDQLDPLVFPGQQWESPFRPDATDGDFV